MIDLLIQGSSYSLRVAHRQTIILTIINRIPSIGNLNAQAADYVQIALASKRQVEGWVFWERAAAIQITLSRPTLIEQNDRLQEEGFIGQLCLWSLEPNIASCFFRITRDYLQYPFILQNRIYFKKSHGYSIVLKLEMSVILELG